MQLLSLVCHKCKHLWQVPPPLGRRDECPKCHADAKVCLNCRYHDRGAHHECREVEAEWVKEKGAGNFCAYFAPGDGIAGEAQQAKAKDKLDQFFKGGQVEGAAPKPGASMAEELKRFLDAKK